MAIQETASLLILSKQQLAQAGIELQVTKKRVKNINFRLKPYLLMVSVPLFMNTVQIAQAVAQRVAWAIDNHGQVLEKYKRKQHSLSESSTADSPFFLWGVKQSTTLSHDQKIAHYREQLLLVIPTLLEKWQPVVGAQANEIRLKKCTHAGVAAIRVRVGSGYLSTFLPISLNVRNMSSSTSCVICIMPIIVQHFGRQ